MVHLTQLIIRQSCRQSALIARTPGYASRKPGQPATNSLRNAFAKMHNTIRIPFDCLLGYAAGPRSAWRGPPYVRCAGALYSAATGCFLEIETVGSSLLPAPAGRLAISG